MLSISDLKRLLNQNEALLQQARQANDARRVTELLIHRAIVKDTLIETLEALLLAAPSK